MEPDVARALDDAILGRSTPCIYRLILKFAALLWPAHDMVLKGYGLGGIRSTVLFWSVWPKLLYAMFELCAVAS